MQNNTPATIAELYTASRRGMQEQRFNLDGAQILGIERSNPYQDTYNVLFSSGLMHDVAGSEPVVRTRGKLRTDLVKIHAQGPLFGTIQEALAQKVYGKLQYAIKADKRTYRYEAKDVELLDQSVVDAWYG